MTDIEKLRFYLLEDKFPYFEEVDLQKLLDVYIDPMVAVYKGCLIKAQDDSVALGPINTVSNENFWLRRSAQFRPNHSGTRLRADNL